MGRRECLQASFHPWLQEWLFLLLLSSGIINPHPLLSCVRPWSWEKMKIRDVLLLATASCKITFAAYFPEKHWGQTQFQAWDFIFTVDLSLTRKEGHGVLFTFAIQILSAFYSLSFWIWVHLSLCFCLQGIHFRLRWSGLVKPLNATSENNYLMSWLQAELTGPECHAAVECEEMSISTQINILFNNIGCWRQTWYKAVLAHDAYSGITHTPVKNWGFGFKLTDHFISCIWPCQFK